MKKIRLNPDALQVSSFATVPAPAGTRGTVAAHQESGFCTPICNWQLTDTCGSRIAACLKTLNGSCYVC